MHKGKKYIWSEVSVRLSGVPIEDIKKIEYRPKTLVKRKKVNQKKS